MTECTDFPLTFAAWHVLQSESFPKAPGCSTADIPQQKAKTIPSAAIARIVRAIPPLRSELTSSVLTSPFIAWRHSTNLASANHYYESTNCLVPAPIRPQALLVIGLNSSLNSRCVIPITYPCEPAHTP